MAYIIGSIHKTTGQWSISASPVEHVSYTKAVKEAERLAGIDTSKDFVVLQKKAIPQAIQVKVTQF